MLEPLPTLRAPDKPAPAYARALPASITFTWLAAGWNDLRHNPGPSLVYGVFLVALSYAVLWALAASGLLYLALPAIAGFLIVGPFLALGLYEKSRAREQGEPTSLRRMLLVRPASRRVCGCRGVNSSPGATEGATGASSLSSPGEPGPPSS